jgi:hypothetical protein
MSTELVRQAVNQIQTTDIEQLLVAGDLSKLNPEQRVRYVQKLCNDTGLNILSRPFDYISLQGKLTLYANKGAAEQLRAVNKISINITAREKIDEVYVVTARAKKPDGREDESTGAVPITGLKGDNLANAMLKAETKAKRRVTLSICGLNMLDETEVDSIPGATKPPSELNAKYGLDKKSDVVMPAPVHAPTPATVEVDCPNLEWEQTPTNMNCGDPLDDFVIRVGKKHAGKTFKEVGKDELQAFARGSFDWFSKEKGGKYSNDWAEFFTNAEIYCFGPMPPNAA